MRQYSDHYCRELVTTISAFEGVPASFDLCRNGAAELFYSYCEAVSPKTAVELAPTFSEYSLGLKRADCEVRRYHLEAEKDFLLNDGFLSFLGEAKPEAVFFCNPNNPTGQAIEQELLSSILAYTKEHHIRFFLDECFLDLSEKGESLKLQLENNP